MNTASRAITGNRFLLDLQAAVQDNHWKQEIETSPKVNMLKIHSRLVLIFSPKFK